MLRTNDKGLLICPPKHLYLDHYIDANFAGQWTLETSQDSRSMKSLTGYLITLGDIPVLWSSKLQTQIATSTMHAEYISLSNSLRDLIPIQQLLEELTEKFGLQREEETHIARVWEDNEGALKLAKKEFPQTTPNSKHYGIKYHWFREQIKELKINIQHISTKVQKEDIFTKGLVKNKFVPKQKLLSDW